MCRPLPLFKIIDTSLEVWHTHWRRPKHSYGCRLFYKHDLGTGRAPPRVTTHCRIKFLLIIIFIYYFWTNFCRWVSYTLRTLYLTKLAIMQYYGLMTGTRKLVADFSVLSGIFFVRAIYYTNNSYKRTPHGSLKSTTRNRVTDNNSLLKHYLYHLVKQNSAVRITVVYIKTKTKS